MYLRRAASVVVVAVGAVTVAGSRVGGVDPTLRAATTPTTVPWTLPPTDPVDPIAEVTAAAVETWDVRMNAYINLDAPGNEAALDAHYTPDGEARAVIEGDLQTLRDQGWRARDNTETPSRLNVELARVQDPTHATVQVCLVDAGVIFEPATSPGGPEAVVDDDVHTFRSVQYFVRGANGWLLDNVDTLHEWPGAIQCPAE